MKVNRAITGATTVNTDAVVFATYSSGSFGGLGFGDNSGGLGGMQGQVTNRVFGPGQSVPATFTTVANGANGFDAYTVTWTLISGVELINTQ